MDILIEDKKVRKLCEDAKHARKKLGDKTARKLGARLADLAAAENLFELPPAFRPHALKGNRAGTFAVDVDQANRIVLEPADEPLPLDAQGTVDWQAVRRVRIIEIGDYHD